MTIKQIYWAMTHDWYYYTGTNSTNGVQTIYCYLPEGGVVGFTDYQKLRAWAGY